MLLLSRIAVPSLPQTSPKNPYSPQSLTMDSGAQHGGTVSGVASSSNTVKKLKTAIGMTPRPAAVYKPFSDLSQNEDVVIQAMVCRSWEAKNPSGKYLGTEYVFGDAQPSVRKQHNSGYKHKTNVRIYYQQFEEQQTQSLIDQRIKEHLGQAAALQQVGAAYAAWQRARPPVLPTPMMPMPGFLPGIRPPVLPRPLPLPPGYGAPPQMAPPPLSAPNGRLPPPPAINMPSSDPAANMASGPNGVPSNGMPPPNAPNFSAPPSFPEGINDLIRHLP